MSMVFGRKTIRSGVMRITPSIRRNIAYQAVVGRMRTAEISEISEISQISEISEISEISQI
jgi:hypothetical protein